MARFCIWSRRSSGFWKKKPFDKKSSKNVEKEVKVEEAKKEEKAEVKEEKTVSKKAAVKEDLSGKTVAELRELAKAKDRIYIVPGCKNEYGFKLSGTNSVRKYVLVSAVTIGFIDKFLGEHTLLYQDDLDAYYIRAKECEK